MLSEKLRTWSRERFRKIAETAPTSDPTGTLAAIRLNGQLLVSPDSVFDAFRRFRGLLPFFLLLDPMSAANNLFAICSKTVGAIRLLAEFENSIQCGSP